MFGVNFIGCSTLKYSKTCLKRPLSKDQKSVFQEQLSLNASQKYCRMLRWEHSAILSTFIKLPFVIKACVLSIFEWPLKTGFTVAPKKKPRQHDCICVSDQSVYTGSKIMIKKTIQCVPTSRRSASVDNDLVKSFRSISLS